MSGPDAASIGNQRLTSTAEALDVPSGGALLVPDTAMPTLDLIAPLERRLGRPVLTANQVTLWQGLKLGGATTRVPGLGRLFA
jgi:maleate isomerase